MSDINKTKKHLMDDIALLRQELQSLEQGGREPQGEDVLFPEDLLKTIPDIVYKIDTKGRFTYLNEAVSILGYTPRELLGQKFEVIVYKDDMRSVSRKHVLPKYKGKITGPENAPKLFDERRTGDRRTRSLEIRLVHKTARKIREEDILTGMLFSYGELTSSGHYQSAGNDKKKHMGSIGVIHDVTPWKKAEMELKASEQKFRALVEDMPALVCRFRRNGVLTFVNTSYCAYFKKSAAELVGSNWYQFLPRKERARVKKHFLGLTPTRPMVSYEHQVVAPDGTIRWQFWTDRAFYDKQGSVVEYQSIGLDITERKLNEIALQQSEKKLAEQNMQLHDKNIAIREMMDQVKTEKERIERRIMENAAKLLLPFLSRLKHSDQPIEKRHIEIVEKNIRELTASFAHKLLNGSRNLTPREVELCTMIKEGLTTKEMAQLLHVSPKTIENQRNSLRKKLNISGKTRSLRMYLLGLS